MSLEKSAAWHIDIEIPNPTMTPKIQIHLH